MSLVVVLLPPTLFSCIHLAEALLCLAILCPYSVYGERFGTGIRNKAGSPLHSDSDLIQYPLCAHMWSSYFALPVGK